MTDGEHRLVEERVRRRRAVYAYRPVLEKQFDMVPPGTVQPPVGVQCNAGLWRRANLGDVSFRRELDLRTARERKQRLEEGRKIAWSDAEPRQFPQLEYERKHAGMVKTRKGFPREKYTVVVKHGWFGKRHLFLIPPEHAASLVTIAASRHAQMEFPGRSIIPRRGF
jgi:hypothetical protein